MTPPPAPGPRAARASDEASPARWLDEREQAAWRGFLDMHSRLTAQLNRELQEDSNISIADFSVLVRLSEHDTTNGDMRILEMARALRWEKSRLSHQLSRMAARGLVERADCADDRRGAFVVLTRLGRETVEQAAPRHVEAVRNYLFDQLTDTQLSVLSEICATVSARLTDAGCAEPGGECAASPQSCAGTADPCQ